MLNTNYSTDEPIWLCKQMCQGCGERVSPHTRQIVTVIQLSKVIGSQNLRYFHASHQLDLFFIKELAKQFHLKHKEELDSLIIHLLDKRVIFIVPSTSSKPCPRLSNHSLQRATTWRATFLDRRKDFRPICLDPVQSKTKHHIRQRYSQHTHSPRGGGGGVHGLNETSSNELQRLITCFANLSLTVTLPTISLQQLYSHPPLYMGDS